MHLQETFSNSRGGLRRDVLLDGVTHTTRMANLSDAHGRSPGWARWWQSFLRGGVPRGDGPPARVLHVADFFCGCGGLALGVREAARAAGCEVRVAAAVDIDREALSVYSTNLKPEVAVCGNLKHAVEYQVRGWAEGARFAYKPDIVEGRLKPIVGRVDAVIAGPPCEGHSNLNNRTRGNDPRNMLLLDAIAGAVALEPGAILVENVPDIVNDSRQVVDTARGLLVDSGYEVNTGILGADRLGLAQTRRRFFMVATRRPFIPLSRIEESIGDRPVPDVRWAIADLMERESESILDAPVQLSPESVRRIAWLFDNDAYDLPDDLRPACHRNGHTYQSVYGRLRWDQPSGTITTGFMTMGRGRFVHPEKRRTLTAREALRLQGFPDWFRFGRSESEIPTKKGLCKLIGDAVPPILGYAAGLSFLPGFLSPGGAQRAS